MIAAEVMVPCVSFAPTCRFDWAAVSAVGGWIAAIVTFFAVLLPYRSQRRAAEEDRVAAADEAEIRIMKFIPKLFTVHNGVPRWKAALENPEHTINQQLLQRWLSELKALPFPDLPKHSRFGRIRRQVAILEVCVDVVSDHAAFERWDSEERESLIDALDSTDHATKGFVAAALPLMEGLDLTEEFPRYFPR